MPNETTARSSPEEVRAWCHQVMEAATSQPADRLRIAEAALEQAPTDAIRQTLVELSVSAPDEVTAAFVLAAVRKGSTHLARAAADLLMDLRAAQNAKEVIAECLESRDISVRRRAVEALETLQDPAALDLLTQALGSGDDTIRRAASNSLGLIIGSKYHPLKDRMLGQLADPKGNLYRTIVESPDVGLRREIAQILSFANSERTLPILEALSRDPDSQTRRETILSLAAIGTDAAAGILKTKLDDSDDVAVATVLDVLAARIGRDSPDMLAALRHALQHPNPDVRRHVVLMLDHFKLEDVEDVLRKAAKDDDFEVARNAKSLLRSLHSPAGVPELGEEHGDYDEDERTLMIWDAGNIGMESESAEAHTTFKRTGSATTDDVIPILEAAAVEGDPSIRTHAVTELAELRDIADSHGLQRALYDPDETIRSRAASALDGTRDAGLLARVLAEHPDALIRRRAAEALSQNPSGAVGEKRALVFTSQRTLGMELFGRFLDAMDDYDDGVRQNACTAIGQYVEFEFPLPAPATLKHLRALVNDESQSSLMRDTAHGIAEELEKADPAAHMVKMVDGVLEWRASIARQAHALKPRSEGGFVMDRAAGIAPEELAARWQADLGLSAEQAKAAAEAMQSGRPVPEEVARGAMQGMVRCEISAGRAVYHASRALALLGLKQRVPNLQQWAKAMSAGPAMEWGDDETVRAWQTMMPRLRTQACIAAVAAAASLGDKPDPSALAEWTGHADDWVRIAALTSLLELQKDGRDTLSQLAELVRTHAAHADYMEVLGPAAVALVGAGDAAFVGLLAKIIGEVQTDLKCELTQALMTAAQDDRVAGVLRRQISAKPGQGLGAVCLALALRGGSGELAANDVPDLPPGAQDIELTCAHRALGAMLGDGEDAAELKTSLRGEQERERYCAASYLGLARVQSAVPIFASVSDQEVQWDLRCLCAGMLVRFGHRLGVGWFAKNDEHAAGRARARMAVEYARAIEDILPLMLKCKDVGLGRFL